MMSLIFERKKNKKFPFHNGSIETDTDMGGGGSWKPDGFPFHNGSIETNENTNDASHPFLISIPQWFDWDTRPRPAIYFIPIYFHSTMVRLRQFAESSYAERVGGDFHSTMVRLRPWRVWWRELVCNGFPFHNGSIETSRIEAPARDRASQFPFHNGSIETRNFPASSLRRQFISIPQWFDWDPNNDDSPKFSFGWTFPFHNGSIETRSGSMPSCAMRAISE